VKSLVLIILIIFCLPHGKVIKGASDCDFFDTEDVTDYSYAISVLNLFCSIVFEQVEKDIVEQEEFDTDTASHIQLLNHITKDISDLHRNFDDVKTFLDLIPDNVPFSCYSLPVKLFLLRIRFAVVQKKQDSALWEALKNKYAWNEIVALPAVDISQQYKCIAQRAIFAGDMKKNWDIAELDGTFPLFGCNNKEVIESRCFIWKKVSKSIELTPRASLLIKQRIKECEHILVDLEIGTSAVDTPELVARRLLRNG